MSNAKTSTALFSVVGIGASAGGLHALEEFFENMSPDSGAAFVVIQHLSPDFKSMMTELLGRKTSMPVYLAENGTSLETNTVYLIPPGQNLLIKNRHLYLTAQDRHQGRKQPNFPIDIFFTSLANDCQNKAIGIILSGTGSDGSRGLKNIYEQGGVTMVQNPSTAEFNGMPYSAIQLGKIDHILNPGELAHTIDQVVNSSVETQPLVSEEQQDLSANNLQAIIGILAEKTNTDFSYYKPTTLSRRIKRRCMIAGFKHLESYTQYLQQIPEEQIKLRNDLLIGVTQFFRNPEAWDFLAAQVIPRLFEEVEHNQPLRCWVTACSTGEEAYSLAILLDEARQRLNSSLEIKIFATDIDSQAIEKASQGIYPEMIAGEISQERLQHYFTYRKDAYQVNRRLREMLIFSEHNIIKDAGFTRMNFVSCRNMLIYMRSSLQQQVLHQLHFSLIPQGILLLGESETLGALEEEFQPQHPTYKIFSKRRDIRLSNSQGQVHPFSHPNILRFPLNLNLPTSSNSHFNPLLDKAFKKYLEDNCSTCLLVDRRNNLLHTIADGAKVLQVPAGRATQDVTQMLPIPLRLPLTTALHRVKQTLNQAQSRNIKVQEGEKERYIQLKVSYFQGNATIQDFILVELKAQENRSVDGVGASLEVEGEIALQVRELENELQQTKENLQATIEALETINEEQQASNEELIASNEELQSTNEELHTVNGEYQSKIKQLVELNNDLDNLLKNTNIGVVFLDETLKIRKFTNAATSAINLVFADVGRPLAHLSHNLTCGDLIPMIEQVMAQGQPLVQEVQLKQTDCYLLMGIYPYHLDAHTHKGVVITFMDINEIKIAQEKAKESETKMKEVNTSLEQKVVQRTQTLIHFSQGLQKLHQISIEHYEDLDQLLSTYLSTGCDIFKLEHGKVGRVKQEQFIFEAVHSDSKSFSKGLSYSVKDAYCKRVFSTRQTIAYSRKDIIPMIDHPLPLMRRLTAYIGTPIYVNGELYGVLAFFSNKSGLSPLSFSGYEQEIIKSMASSIGNAIETYQMETALLESNKRYRLVFEGSSEGLWDWDIISNKAVISSRYKNILGYDNHEDIITSFDTFAQQIHPDDAPKVLASVKAHLSQKTPYDLEYRLRQKNGDYIWIKACGKAVWDENGQPIRMAGSVQDISARKKAEVIQAHLQAELENALSEEQQLAEITLKSINDAVITTDESEKILYMNPMAEALTGWETKKAEGKAIADVITLIDETTNLPLPNPLTCVLAGNCTLEPSATQLLLCSDGKKHPIEPAGALIYRQDGTIRGAVLIIRDVSQSRNLARKLSWQASHDPLTGLLNRQYFEERLQQAIESVHQEKHRHILCYLDLDKFKIVNDTCGHKAGDELLKQVVTLLQESVRSIDTVARLGGDEFGILLYQCPLRRANSIMEEIRQTIHQFQFVWDNKSFGIGVSIGLVEINATTTDIKEAMMAADAACYSSKHKGRNCVTIYQPDDLEVIKQQQEQSWSVRLRHALDNHQFCLFHQPIIPLLDQEPEIYHEILLRLVNDSGEYILPGAFIPAAERYSLMGEIDRWVVHHSFDKIEQETSQVEQKKANYLYSINLSGRTFNDNYLLPFLEQEFKQFSLSPKNICFEITETAAIANIRQARYLMQIVKGWGCRFALDDFGSGVSYFSYLKELPIDYVKIDGRFVRDIIDDPSALAIVEGVNNICHGMGVKTIAEFVENEQILEKLKDIKVDYAQGYGIAIPKKWDT
ncbi:MAG: EAL domain-containing protein [Microcystaceae cyanobacterium]